MKIVAVIVEIFGRVWNQSDFFSHGRRKSMENFAGLAIGAVHEVEVNSQVSWRSESSLQLQKNGGLADSPLAV